MRYLHLLLNIVIAVAMAADAYFTWPMLQQLDEPMEGEIIYYETQPSGRERQVGSEDYRMKRGDILVGLTEYGDWYPFPKIEVSGEEIVGYSFGNNKYVVAYIYSAAAAELVDVTYTSDFSDTVRLSYRVHPYNELVIDPDQLLRRAGVKRTDNFDRLHLADGFQLKVATFGCFGGAEDHFSLTPLTEGTRLSYKSYSRDTTLHLPITYSSILADVSEGVIALSGEQGECTASTEYTFRANGRQFYLENLGCAPNALNTLVNELRARVK